MKNIRKPLSIGLNSTSLVFNFICFVLIPNWSSSLIHLLFCAINVGFIVAEKYNMFDRKQ